MPDERTAAAGSGADLDAVASDLYSLDPSEFTPARERAAGDARRAGRRELAAAIKALRRPTTAAWVTNLLSRQRRNEVDELAQLGDRLREAQRTLSAEELRTLGRQRHQVVSRLAQQAAALARERGRDVSETVVRDVEATLEAALADSDAAAAVRSGMLVRSLEPAGFGSVDLTGAIPAGTAPAASPAETPVAGAWQRPEKPKAGDDGEARVRRRQEWREAVTRAERAEREADDAERRRDEAATGAESARYHAEATTERVRRLERELEAARRDAEAATARAEQADIDHRDAERDAEQARQEADLARGCAERLGAGVEEGPTG